MIDRYIPQIEPCFDNLELKHVTDVIKSSYITENKATEKFLALIRGYCNSEFAIASSNGTVALIASLLSEGIGCGDEVIVPDLTFIASANAVTLTGATPVFCDIDKTTLGLDPVQCEQKITPKTKAIMPVHLYGFCSDMEAITALGRKHDLIIIEDAAEAFGVFVNGKHAGTFGDYGIFSFFANKTIACGEGGVTLTNSIERYQSLYRVKNHGRDRKGIFVHEFIGYNFCFSDLHAAIGLAQFEKLEFILQQKKRNFDFYVERLGKLQDVTVCQPQENITSNYWFCNILIPDPEKLANYLEKNRIGTRRFFFPLHKQPCYQHFSFDDTFPVSCDMYEHGLSLPSSPRLKEEELAYICDCIEAYFR